FNQLQLFGIQTHAFDEVAAHDPIARNDQAGTLPLPLARMMHACAVSVVGAMEPVMTVMEAGMAGMAGMHRVVTGAVMEAWLWLGIRRIGGTCCGQGGTQNGEFDTVS